ACLQRSTVRGVYILHIDVHRCGYCRPLGRILVCEHYNAVVNSQFGVKHAAGLAGEAPKLFGTEYLLEELDGAGSAVDDEVGRYAAVTFRLVWHLMAAGSSLLNGERRESIARVAPLRSWLRDTTGRARTLPPDI